MPSHSNKYLFYFYVPNSHVQAVKDAVFNSGAGSIGDYTHCCWESLGQGQFMPNEKSNPFIGNHRQICTEPETKIELVCTSATIQSAVSAMKSAHPYEEPAYGVIQLSDY